MSPRPTHDSRRATRAGSGQAGFSIVTAICLTEADRERLSARSLAEYFPSRTYGVAVRKGKYLSPQARAFVELIKPALFERGDYYSTGQSER